MVQARRGPTTPVRRAWFGEHVLGSMWFVPLCFAVLAIVASRVTLAVDTALALERPPRFLLPGDAAAVSAVSATVATAMLTFFAVVFSTTLVAVQLASSQYSPRIVRVFVRSRMTQVTLGVFVATFLFALNGLIGIRQGAAPVVPAITASVTYGLVVGTVLIFIAFLHGMVRLLRVQYLLHLIARTSYAVIDLEFPPAEAYRRVPAPAGDGPQRVVANAGESGTLQAIDVGGLAEKVRAHDCWVELLVGVGEHVGHRTPVARVHGASGGGVPDRVVTAHLLLGGERTLLQDPAFGIRQLVDTASRALSPAINDPTTAVQALQHVVDLLARIADRPDPTGWYTDEAGVVRVKVPEDDFERLAVLGLTEILRYGDDAPQVTRRLAAAYDELEALVGPDRVEVIDALRMQHRRAVAEALPDSFTVVASRPDRLGLG